MQLEVLLVEDSPSDAFFIRESLATAYPTAYTVLTVDRLAAAEATLATRIMDVALLDLGLPDSNGLNTFLQLRRAQPDLTVLVLTGLDDEDTALRAMQAGAQDYLPKDQLSPALLHRSIRYAVERNRVTRALRETESRFRELAETIREVFWLTDPGKARIIYISPGYEAIWGRSAAALYQDAAAWIEAIHPDDTARIVAALPRQALGTYDEEYRIIRPDGVVRWIRDQAFPVRGEGGEVLRIAGVAEDITERRHLEAQLRQTQKMESIGQLAGGIAHDFNNWLTVIAGNIELLQADGIREGDTPELLAEVLHATERASALTRQLLAFSRREVIEPKVTDLNLVVIEAEKMLHRLLGEDIVLTTVLAPDLAKVRVDPSQWSQVLLNLAVNARDAMAHGGQLSIETRNVALDEDYARLHPGVTPGPYVALAVADNGEGIPPEIRHRIFEPFFTTRAQGTGLGLTVVKRISDVHGGEISLQSVPGKGTLFRMLLPIERAEPSVPSAPHNAKGQAR